MSRFTYTLPALFALPPLLGALSALCGAQQEWDTAGNHTYSTNSGAVGIGVVPTDSTQYKLQVLGDVNGGIMGRSTGTLRAGVYGEAGTKFGVGVKGFSSDGHGFDAESWYGKAIRADSDNGYGIYVTSEYGTGLYAESYDGIAATFNGPVNVTGGTLTCGTLDASILSGFVGVNRNSQITSSEVFGTYANTSGFSGMYVATSGEYGDPFYGYSTGGNVDAYHYYEGNSGSWRLLVGSGVRMAVKNTGNVGIGTLTPLYKLHVNGSAGKPGGGSWSNASDLRLKKNVRDLSGSLDKLLSLRGVTYEYKDPSVIQELPGVHTGVIAQEVEQVFPEWVDEAPDGYKRVTFRGFEALTVEAVRELDRSDRDLRQQNADLRRDNQRLQGEVGDLQQRLADLEVMIANLVEATGDPATR